MYCSYVSSSRQTLVSFGMSRPQNGVPTEVAREKFTRIGGISQFFSLQMPRVLSCTGMRYSFPAESTYVIVPGRQGFFSPLSFLRRPMFVVSVIVTGCSDLKNEPWSRGGFRTLASPFFFFAGC